MESRLVERLVARLKFTDATLALAESRTGGMASAAMVSVSGVSQVYRGAVVSYDNEVKERVLGIPRTLIQTHGAVSRPVAREMARGAKSLLRATWAGSITGVAGPGGGTPEKPVGTVCFGISGPGVEVTEQMHFAGDRAAIQQQSVTWILQLLLDFLEGQRSLK
jgi:PncC family amidohydrolase